jgi:hypothetical protein
MLGYPKGGYLMTDYLIVGHPIGACVPTWVGGEYCPGDSLGTIYYVLMNAGTSKLYYMGVPQ